MDTATISALNEVFSLPFWHGDNEYVKQILTYLLAQVKWATQISNEAESDTNSFFYQNLSI